MATAIEYALIAAGISGAIIVVTTMGTESQRRSWDADKKTAAAACAQRPADSTHNVVIKDWLGRKAEYSCPSVPSIFNPTYVGIRS